MKSLPGFSIIIPTYNRIASLKECLRGIAALDYPRTNFQVNVINDGGPPIPSTLEQEFQSKIHLCILNQQNSGASVARNTGAHHAQHEWLVFTDDDCVPARDWLQQFAAGVQAYPRAVLGGATRNGLRENVYAEASQCLIGFLYAYYHQRQGPRSQLPYFASNNLAMARTVFETVGGFDATMRFAEDRDLCARLVYAGFPLQYVSTARVLHYRSMNLISFWRQHQMYGKGAYQYHQNLRRIGSHKFRLEPTNFYFDLVRYPWQYSHEKRGRLASLVTIAQIANAVGFFSEKFRARQRVDSIATRNAV